MSISKGPPIKKPNHSWSFRFKRDWRTGPVFITCERKLGKILWKQFGMAFSHLFPSFTRDSKRDDVTFRFYSAFAGYVQVVSRWEPSQNITLKLLRILLLCLKRSYWNEIRRSSSISQDPDCTEYLQKLPKYCCTSVDLHYTILQPSFNFWWCVCGLHKAAAHYLCFCCV